MFTKAIVRTPGRSLINGITSANLGVPDYDLALLQHKEYIEALKSCGLEVIILPPDERYPDSTFIEDVALLTNKCAIITNPGALSRKGEINELDGFLSKLYIDIEYIKNPGTVEAGDIMMAGNHFFIGVSERTNKIGADQMCNILRKYNHTASLVPLKKVLHLKTGLAYLENNTIAACGEFLHKDEFRNINVIEIDEDESYAANCIWINGKVIIPHGYPKAKEAISSAGYNTIEVDVSEFRKLDGGLSCLSLRF